MRHVRVAAAGVAGAALLLAGCSSSTSKPAASPAAAPTSVATTATPAPATPSSAPADDGLTGFGATWDTWDATRFPDDNASISMNHNTGYSPDAELPVTNNTAHDRYSVVGGTDTYVTTYQVNFHGGTGINAALADVLGREFPTDAKWLWKNEVAGQCYEAEVKSATLAKAATSAGLGDGTGEVFVFFQTLPPGGNLGYDPHDVTYASLAWGSYANAAAAGDC